MNAQILRMKELTAPDRTTIDLLEMVMFMLHLVPDAITGGPKASYWNFGLKELQNRAERFLKEEMDDFEFNPMPEISKTPKTTKPSTSNEIGTNTTNRKNKRSQDEVNLNKKTSSISKINNKGRQKPKSFKKWVKAKLLKGILWIENVMNLSNQFRRPKPDITFNDENRYKSA